jgi:general stress protein 26
MSDATDRQAQTQKLWSLIKDIRIGMLTTADDDGTLRSRPMGNLDYEFSGDLWFFTYGGSPKAQDVEQERQVNVAYSNPDDNVWVSVSGTATVVRERERMEELWSPILKTWFPKGLDEPDIALLRISVTKAEYWDAPSSTLIHLYGFVKSQLTGRPPEGGENEKLDLERSRG